MEHFLFYLLKVAVLITAMFALYKLLLGNETFYRFNRIILLTMGLLSFILPLCNISQYLEKLDSVITTDVLKTLTEVNLTKTSDDAPVNAPINSPVIVADNTRDIVNSGANTQSIPESPSSNRNILMQILMIMYCAVFVLVLIKKTISVLSIAKVINKGRYANRLDGCDVIESDSIRQPLNWMKYIVMPKEWLDKNNSAVWQHENFHARKWHSIDLLISDLMTTIQWFNPVMILFHKELALIHEYEADRAVIDSGADVHEYKLMLVNAVASSRGFGMTSWLKQSNLKNRIDMMNKTNSNGWNKLKALFIPLLAGFFLLVNSSITYAKIDTFSYPVFEEGTVWIFKDGKAKIKTFDGVEANMNVDDVPMYLKNYKAFKTKRISLRYMYPIDGLESAQPLAEKLAAVGIKSSFATDDEILKNMTMPEYRCARIYDEGNGKYRFEMNRKQTYALSNNGKTGIKDNSLSISGDIELMKKWIGIFDGHGVAIYPKSMPYSDVEQMAQATWDRGLNQVSIVDREKSTITLVPLDRKLSKEFPGADALYVARKLNDEVSTNYFSKGTRIQDPKSFYNSDPLFFNITDVVRTKDALIIIYSSFQGPDLWITGTAGTEILVDGKTYKQTKYEGLKGFEKEYFWSPDNGTYIQNIQFPAIPEDVKTIDLYDSETKALLTKGLQVSEDASSLKNIRTKRLSGMDKLKTGKIHEDMEDIIQVVRADFSDTETTIYVEMHIFEPHSFLGHVGSDFTLTLGDGQILRPVRVDGVPVDEDFDRHGDHVTTYFQLIFPPISEEAWTASIPILEGTICHEPLTFRLTEPRSESINLISEALIEMPKGDFEHCLAIIQDENSVTQITLKGISFDGKGRMIVSGDKVNLLLGDGTHSVSLGKKADNSQKKFVIKSHGKELELLISRLTYKNSSGEVVDYGYVLRKMDGKKMEYQVIIQE